MLALVFSVLNFLKLLCLLISLHLLQLMIFLYFFKSVLCYLLLNFVAAFCINCTFTPNFWGVWYKFILAVTLPLPNQSWWLGLSFAGGTWCDISRFQSSNSTSMPFPLPKVIFGGCHSTSNLWLEILITHTVPIKWIVSLGSGNSTWVQLRWFWGYL